MANRQQVNWKLETVNWNQASDEQPSLLPFVNLYPCMGSRFARRRKRIDFLIIILKAGSYLVRVKIVQIRDVFEQYHIIIIVRNSITKSIGLLIKHPYSFMIPKRVIRIRFQCERNFGSKRS